MTSEALLAEESSRNVAGKANVWLAACVVFAVSLGWFLFGTASAPLIDRDEPMIAEVARQMVHRHEWLIPHVPAWEDKSIFKPPMAMWGMAASFKMLGISEFAARLPSTIYSALTATIVFVVAARRWGRRAGWVAAACMTLSLLPAVAGRMVLTDPLVTLLGTIILLSLDKSLRVGGSLACNLTIWILAGLGILAKGPVVLVFLAPAVVMAADGFRWRPYIVFAAALFVAIQGSNLALNGHEVPGILLEGIGGLVVAVSLLRWLVRVVRLPIGVAWGLPLMLIACGWWFVYVMAAGGAVQQASAKRFILFEILRRIVRPIEHHFGPPGYYLVVAMIGLLPFSALLPGLLGWALRYRKVDATVQLLLAWVIGSWMLCECASTKLPHYILPAWPALALLAGVWWQHSPQVASPTDRRRAFAIAVPVLIFAAAAGIVAVLAWQDGVRIWLGDRLQSGAGNNHSRIWEWVAYLGRMESWQVSGLLLAPLLLVIACSVTWLMARRRSAGAGIVALTTGWAPALLLLLSVVLSRSPFCQSLSQQAAMQAISLGQLDTKYYAVGYTEPGVFFYLPAGQYERVEKTRDIASLARTDESFVLIASRKLERAVRESLGGRIAEMRIAAGINAARGQPETACVFRIASTAEASRN